MRADDSDDNPNLNLDRIKIYATETRAVKYDVYPGETIDSSEEWYDLFHQLRSAKENDVFVFHLNNFGGSVATGVQLIQVLKETKAYVIMSIEAPIYSMASIIALAGHGIAVGDHALMMFHDYSTVEMGKGNEIERSTESYRKFSTKLMEEVCFPFLTKAEIKQIERGEDLYIHKHTEINQKTGKPVKGIDERLKKLEEQPKRKSK